MAFDHPLAVMRRWRAAGVRRKHRCLGLLALQDQHLVRVMADKQADGTTGAHRPDPHGFQCRISEPEMVHQMLQFRR